MPPSAPLLIGINGVDAIFFSAAHRGRDVCQQQREHYIAPSCLTGMRDAYSACLYLLKRLSVPLPSLACFVWWGIFAVGFVEMRGVLVDINIAGHIESWLHLLDIGCSFIVLCL
jgi:hypothetical protein